MATKYLQISNTGTSRIDIFFHKKKSQEKLQKTKLIRQSSLIEREIKNGLEKKKNKNLKNMQVLKNFLPMNYSFSSLYLIELMMTIYIPGRSPEEKGKINILQRAMNLREVINLQNSEKLQQNGNYLSERRISYDEIRRYAGFMLGKIKTSNLFDTDISSNENDCLEQLHNKNEIVDIDTTPIKKFNRI